MQILIQQIEAALFEVKGQYQENGENDPRYKDAVKALMDETAKLYEACEGE